MSPPRPCSIMIRAASRETRKLPFAITSCCRSQSCSVVSSSGLEIDRPALLTTRSTPPKASAAARNAAATASPSVTSAATPIATSEPPISAAASVRLLPGRGRRRRRRRPRRRAGPRWPCRCPSAAPVTSATRVASGLGLGIRCELGLLQRPVLDAELLALVDRRVGGDRLGAAHHVDGVDVELAGDAGGLLVRAEAEHADAGHQHDRRVGAAHRRAVRGRVPLRSRRRTRRGTPRAAPSAARRRPRPGRSAAGRRPAAAPWCAGSGRGRRCPARPDAGARPRPGSRGRRRRR